MARTDEQWAAYWAQWDYTRPIADALTAEFGVAFGAENTGGNCICITPEKTLEGNVSIYIGSGVDGPLWTNEHRAEYRAEHGRFDGYGLSIVEADEGQTLAAVTDQLAESPADVVAMVKRGLAMARTDLGDERTDHPSWVMVSKVDGRFSEWRGTVPFEVYPAWERDHDGTVREEQWPV